MVFIKYNPFGLSGIVHINETEDIFYKNVDYLMIKILRA